MRFNTMFFLLILSSLCLALAQMTYEDCCFKYVKQMNPRIQKHAVEYRRQVLDGGCNIPAVIFTMRKGRELCTDPRERWVNDLVKKIDKRALRNDHNKSKKHQQPNRN
ncbi:C-C motif chemokine 25 [Anoplopoma fimbria]|uniref:C-C motif chemokine n=1 Tax=Anoplopoma fimbria TaxID=229290 RepID=C3KH68_ANOFI|nr:C-C motif chemokine 25 [Anoplopoma fimbria]ACQ57990.1 C-C motif chemokine 25 precursor [Anoplopoma fimbria]